VIPARCHPDYREPATPHATPPRIPKELPMRIPALAILALVTVSMAAPAEAQTYDPSYPVCMQVSGREASYIQCTFTSLAQCQASASGRSATCVMNPYPGRSAARAPDRRRGVY
jgi:hypothetical protein